MYSYSVEFSSAGIYLEYEHRDAEYEYEEYKLRTVN
jgi:hypothetical protein